MTTFAVGTIIAPNYEAYARVLAQSLKRVHDTQDLNVLVLDEQGAGLDCDGVFQTVVPSDLPIERSRFHAMAAMYSVMELATALKPWLLRLLLSRGPDVAIFLDPDIEMFAPIDEIVRLAAEHDIIVTPHVTQPIPRDNLRPEEEDFLISGTFNLGFIAVSQRAVPFLEWWQERLFTQCIVKIEKGLFVDQRWVDLAVQYFRHHVLRDPGFNVAYWNIHERRVSTGNSGYTVDGQPLRAFHYSGFDPEQPSVLSRFTYGKPRFMLEDHDLVQGLCDGYRAQLLSAGWEHSRSRPYNYSAAADGTPLIPELRSAYRSAVLANKPGVLPPDPFDPGAVRAFEAWVASELRPAIKKRLRTLLRRVYQSLTGMRRDAAFLRMYARSARRSKARKLSRWRKSATHEGPETKSGSAGPGPS